MPAARLSACGMRAATVLLPRCTFSSCIGRPPRSAARLGRVAADRPANYSDAVTITGCYHPGSSRGGGGGSNRPSVLGPGGHGYTARRGKNPPHHQLNPEYCSQPACQHHRKSPCRQRHRLKPRALESPTHQVAFPIRHIMAPRYSPLCRGHHCIRCRRRVNKAPPGSSSPHR